MKWELGEAGGRATKWNVNLNIRVPGYVGTVDFRLEVHYLTKTVECRPPTPACLATASALIILCDYRIDINVRAQSNLV